MVATFLLILLSVGIALPLGLCAGIYLAEYASPKARHVFGFMVALLAGTPSIVVGLFGFSITIFLHHFYNSRCRFRRTNPIKISVLITRQAIDYRKAGRAFTLPALII
ncbi:hypothetical protein [Desulfobacter sp. UBA2225]|uniref:hypothetical protein n=1 Tax=Desulfobacter sp. UBA2225 TaxID=1961413 RepID=UPI00257A014F|nr:hypothetical protein [Desulfobacter sp. UBA2225]